MKWFLLGNIIKKNLKRCPNVQNFQFQFAEIFSSEKFWLHACVCVFACVCVIVNRMLYVALTCVIKVKEKVYYMSSNNIRYTYV